MRQRGVTIKLNPLREVVRGQRLTVVDDSIVRGTTTQADRRRCCARPARPRSTSGSAPRRSTTRASTASTPRSRPSSSRRPTRSRRSGSSSAPTRSATCRSRGVLAALELPYERFCFACFDGNYPEPVPYDAAEPQVHPRGGPARRRPPGSCPVVPGRRAWLTLRRTTSGPGVDVAAGERAVELMRAAVASTRRPEVVGGLGGFAGRGRVCRTATASRSSSVATDGVGTKTAIAPATRALRHASASTSSRCAPTTSSAAGADAAVLPRLRRGRAARSRATSPSSSGGSRPAAGSPAARSSAARRRSTRGSWTTTSSTWPASASASSSATGSSTGRRSGPGDAIVGLAVVRAPRERLLARPRRCVAEYGLRPGRAPFQERLRRSLGDAARIAHGGRAGARAGDARRGAADADPGLRRRRSSGCATTLEADGRAGSAAWPTSPAADCRATCPGRCRPAWRRGSTRRGGRCRRSCACSARSAGSRTTSCGPRSTAASG